MSKDQRQLWKEAYENCHEGDDDFVEKLRKARSTEPVVVPKVVDQRGPLRLPKAGQVLCVLHGKVRSIGMMVDDGMGNYSCLPDRRCKSASQKVKFLRHVARLVHPSPYESLS